MALLVLLNNFFHDFCAAGWIFGSVILWRLLKTVSGVNDCLFAIIAGLVLKMMRWCFAGIVLFGVIRALVYRSFEWNEAAGDAQVTLLLVKHVFFAAVFVPGLLCYLKIARLIKGNGVYS